jgi:hypothetical protein
VPVCTNVVTTGDDEMTEKKYLIRRLGHGSATPTWVDAAVIMAPIWVFAIYMSYRFGMFSMVQNKPIDWMFLFGGIAVGWVTLIMVRAVGLKRICDDLAGFGVTMFGVAISLGLILMGLGFTTAPVM